MVDLLDNEFTQKFLIRLMITVLFKPVSCIDGCEFMQVKRIMQQHCIWSLENMHFSSISTDYKFILFYVRYCNVICRSTEAK